MTTSATTNPAGGGEAPSAACQSPAAIVAAANLPPELAQRVLDVTARARLWKSERSTVAHELVAHFRDGLESGATPADLLSAFGEPRAAARLITRAVRRKRPLWWRTARALSLAGTAGVLLLAGGYGLLAARFYWSTPTLRFNVLQELNAPFLAVPKDQRAWPIYREAHLAIGRPPDALYESAPNLYDTRRGQPGYEAVLTHFRTIAPNLDTIRRAAAMPIAAVILAADTPDSSAPLAAGQVPDPGGLEPPGPNANPMGIGILLPQLGIYRQFARLLAFDARDATIANDPARYTADLNALLGIADHAHEDGTVISQLVSAAVYSIALDLVRETLADHPRFLTDAQLKDLATRLSTWRPALGSTGEPLKITLERRAFDDALQRFYTDDGEGDGHITAALFHISSEFGRQSPPTSARLAAPAASTLTASRRETKAVYDRYLALVQEELAKPLWQRTFTTPEQYIDQHVGTESGRLRHPLVAYFAPAFRKAATTIDTTFILRDATLAAIAIELHTRARGQPPAQLADLVPSFLPALPIDRWSGKPLGYKPDGGEATGHRPLIYSVGADHTDDGGAFGTPWFPEAARFLPKAGPYSRSMPALDWPLFPIPRATQDQPAGWTVPADTGYAGINWTFPWPYGGK